MIAASEGGGRVHREDRRRLASAARGATWTRLLERKRKDVPGATRVERWEKAYLEDRVKRSSTSFDSQSVRPYFEYARVRAGRAGDHRAVFGVALRAA